MGKFITFDFKKRHEKGKLKSLVSTISSKMDKWISSFENDGTPPNEEQARTLEEEKISELLEEFDKGANPLQRIKDEHAEYRDNLSKKLCSRMGRLYKKYSDDVSALEEQAAMCMIYCKETLQDFEEDLQKSLPTSTTEVENSFKELMENCRIFIETSYPEGVEGIDNYDDGFEDGIPSFDEFRVIVEEKKDKYKLKNQDAIAPAVEKVKEDCSEMFKNKINDAIKQAMEEIKIDLSDDVLPYLNETDMVKLREELISSAVKYGNGRLEE
mmetsp:Transcript_11257/g.12890  ORF Transcript_11257/g.12890 Transcript_11257/m.12890 type:complete len:270 (+) Transcript_11257:34-843(+)|eukprot:CAMPEP_0194133086 /NCGR_PEP_ID=MMETSP0152-20130528/3386_1 /TAXON_ID=1049557 /ORGANISM="Thalassiothrix antarctica, Strain L6-D1" /LENGTH=269 /DNA_ID=CAMNT_0038828321 /DNA_START=38 /DNA_END=847 /DNA_ORIENTATION=-